MLVNKLQENKDKDAEASQVILANAIKYLKKKSIPKRLRALLTILDKCDPAIEGNGLTTAGSLLSYFTDEMQALNQACYINGYYSKADDQKAIQEACTIYRVKKYSKK